MKNKFKEFKPTSWAIDNRIAMYLIVFIIIIFGILNYRSIPKEQFPEIVIPTILVNTVYPGTSPADIENLITRPLEKNIKSVGSVNKISSNSMQDYSSIVVEFKPTVDVSDAKQKVKDAVDKTKSDLPGDLPFDPLVMEIDFSEIPIMYINVSGNLPLRRLKDYSEIIQDKIESLPEITRVDLIGALDREIQIDVDMYKMQAARATFSDIERAIASENVTIAGGTIEMQGMRRSIRIVGEIKDPDIIRNIVFTASGGGLFKISDIAEVKDSYKEQESFARFNGQNVITLNVVKKSGANLLNASDKIKDIISNLKETKLPHTLNVSITGDMSKFTRTTLDDLNNTIIIGFILVVIVLMFFMGFTNAIFVALAVPLSVMLVYSVLPSIGFTMNMLVMFSFIFALGIVVDDAIVVVENTHRIFNKSGLDIVPAAKYAAGEVFIPIFSGTLTLLAPFFPLAFWPGIVGKFMHYIPITLMLTLFASLVVAYLFNPVFAASFMKRDKENRPVSKRNIFVVSVIAILVSAISYMANHKGLGNLILFLDIIFVFYNLYGYKIILQFQKEAIPYIILKYEKMVRWAIAGTRPYILLASLVVLFIFTIIITAMSKPKVVFFPDNIPNNVFVYIKLPVGTDVKATDSLTRTVEKRVMEVVGDHNPIVESVIANVARGASQSFFDMGNLTSHKGRVSVNFVETAKRNGVNTTEYLEKIREALKNIPGAEITVEKNKMGPPTGRPINIEVSGDDLEEIISVSQSLISHINNLNIPGIEELKTDFENRKPELIIDIDRARANNAGISTGQIGMDLRNAVLGKEISKFRENEEQYPVQLRYNEYQRKNIDRLMNHKITFRDMNTGKLKNIPVSAVATIRYENTYGGITRQDAKRVITIYSNVISGYSPNDIIPKINESLADFNYPQNIEIKFTGEQEQQQESMSFLGKAVILSILLILLFLIIQFNSISKPLIILSEVVFSIIGVLLGFIIFKIPFSIVLTGLGVVALSGIVVRNGILLVEFADTLKSRKFMTRNAIVESGKTRIIPVVLTATTTILGLIPLAIGLNINFGTLFSEFQPNIYLGGDNSVFFGALSWSIIFGLTIATVLTLVFIPVMYFIAYSSKIIVKRKIIKRKIKKKM